MTSEQKVGEELKHKEGEVFHLFTEAGEEQDSVIPLRWCVCKEALEKLKKRGAKNLHMLIVVVSKESGYEKRYLVPLEKEMTFVSFQRPGKHVIYAAIVWPGADTLPRFKKHFLEEYSRSSYEKSVLNYEKTGFIKEREHSFDPVWAFSLGEEKLEFDVAKEFFAKEPPALLKKWANFWFEHAPVDQCQFRRRCILAFTLQPPLVLLWTIFKFVSRLLAVVFYLSLGFRRINLKPLIRLYGYEFKDIESNLGKSIFASIWWPFTPLLLACEFLILFFLNLRIDGFPLNPNPLQIVGLVALGSAALFALQMTLFGIGFLFTVALGKLSGVNFTDNEKFKIWQREQKQQAEQKEFAKLWAGYEELSCPGLGLSVELRASLDALPKHRRTIHLRFLDLKRKVCKPFAR